MIIEVRVPLLAESIAEATLMDWHKKVGDPVKHGDSLVDIETDKVTLEIAALKDGVLSGIIKNNGESVQSDEIIAHIDTEANITEPEPFIEERAQQSLPEMENMEEEEAQTESILKLSPVVRNLIEEHQLDIENIPTKRDDGRITREDVIDFIENDKQETTPTEPESEPEPIADTGSAEPEQPATENQAEAAATPAILTPGNVTENRPEEKVAMTRLRKRVAERLLAAQHENAMLTTFNEVNMQTVMDIRARYKDEFARKHQVKLGFMSFFTRAAVEALKQFPLVNASVDGDNIVYHGYFDIGIAVSSPHGLVVPVIRDADLLSLAEIEAKIRDYGEKAQERKLEIADLDGGTFTISNGGIFGSLLSTPIINPPQSAILGMHKIQDRPVAENGQIVIRPMMYLALSYDHRIIDGREAVQYLATIKNQLEDPARLLLQI